MEDSFAAREREPVIKTLLRIIALWAMVSPFIWLWCFVGDGIGLVVQILLVCTLVIYSERAWRIFQGLEDIYIDG